MFAAGDEAGIAWLFGSLGSGSSCEGFCGVENVLVEVVELGFCLLIVVLSLLIVDVEAMEATNQGGVSFIHWEVLVVFCWKEPGFLCVISLFVI